ncbi:CLUMA_CG017361, isoform A [Clunio marinus]|uniref:CLUMA_CG017361, isoform A n=1 Tax=Clunio marinus TaxID=568069 RepID=A0A1J1IYN2_9DIPT|nr:CLUMA_CG017361, isoform A [Clunio marinus]
MFVKINQYLCSEEVKKILESFILKAEKFFSETRQQFSSSTQTPPNSAFFSMDLFRNTLV